MRFDGFFHGDFVGVPGFGVEFGAQARERLRVFGYFVRFAGSAFADALFVVEADGMVSDEQLFVCVGKAYRLPCSRSKRSIYSF